MSDSGVDRRSGRDVTRFTGLFFLIGTEEPRVMPLLDNDKRNARFVIRFQLDTSFSDGRQFVLEHSAELAFANAVTVHDDPVGFETRCLVKQDQQFSVVFLFFFKKSFRYRFFNFEKKFVLDLPNHGAELLNNLLAVLLNTDGSSIARWVSVHGADNGSDGRLFVVAGWWVCHVST